jgi:RNA:NAD 2'-phosphotransferase (TPT1/KptA family)
MNRRFVHFSSDVDWIIDFLSDKPEWVIFAIRTDAALQAGIEFRMATFHVWLTDSMDPRFLAIHLSNVTDAEIRRAVGRVNNNQGNS